ncbi:ABC transporter substrate-binding protein [Tindallia californiensis]|uniref:Iron complex transport system substrate-binding protein n=1 Tax=Tindallia californiensis TaxID=159292 RepID=A0A1H3R6E0_9FIRM|nr:ABC transporter substrate-binding protein [Tindallia californiensis]SDZ20841.1 iron complex transport system substrate-binding protein [Tindallia californiensis]
MKKSWSNILFLLLILALVTGCGRTGSGSENQSESELDLQNEQVEEVENDRGETSGRIIIDQLGREVEIPDEINRVVTDRILPFPSVYFLATGRDGDIVGMHPASKSAYEHSMLSVLAPGMQAAETGFASGEEINIEELLMLDPDLVFIRAESGLEGLYEEAGIRTVAIGTTGIADGDVLKTINSWIEMLGEIYDLEDRAQGIIDYGLQVENEITEKVQDLEEKPRAMMLFNHVEGKPLVSGANFFGNYWLTTTGAIDVAEEEITGRAPVEMEQIYDWNPEIIYITNFTALQPEDFYNNEIQGQDWSQIHAVKNKRVYKIPMGIYRWFPPSGDAPLMLQWLAQHNQPDLFDYDMEEEIRSYYAAYYDYELSQEEIHAILNPVREGAAGGGGQ